jgi:hypothetical protein
MKRTTARLCVGIFVALAVVLGFVAVYVRGGLPGRETDTGVSGGKATTSESQLVAANYKVLTPTKTRALLRYAEAAYGCLSRKIDIGKPRPERTKIVMALRGAESPAAVAQMAVMCAAKLGDPPTDASFQVRGRTVILYLPRYCILDKKVATPGAGR